MVLLTSEEICFLNFYLSESLASAAMMSTAFISALW